MLDWKLLAGAAGIVAAVVFVIWLIFFCARRIREHLKGRELDAMEGHDFEYFCADLLEDHGFKSVEVTRGSGDYGVDVLAEKEGVTYAVQCKRYDGPVGVKAVQEAYAGRDYYDRMVGAVMTNQYFTEPAVIARHGREAQTEEILAGAALMRDAEDVFLPSYDGLRLHGQLLQQPGAKGTILLFHGYRSSWIIDFSIVLPYYYSLGYNLLAVDERAHGQSEGVYITFGVHERRDAATWAQYAAMHFGLDHPLFLGGLSMGATTVLLASALELPPSVRGVIADCGFSSPEAIMRSVLRAHVKWLPAGPLLGLMDVCTRVFAGFSIKEASTLDAVSKTKRPILFIHGTADTFVPCAMSQAAYDVCASEKQLILVDGARHGYSYLVDRPRVQAALAAFLEKYTSQEAIQ